MLKHLSPALLMGLASLFCADISYAQAITSLRDGIYRGCPRNAPISRTGCQGQLTFRKTGNQVVGFMPFMGCIEGNIRVDGVLEGKLVQAADGFFDVVQSPDLRFHPFNRQRAIDPSLPQLTAQGVTVYNYPYSNPTMLYEVIWEYGNSHLDMSDYVIKSYDSQSAGRDFSGCQVEPSISSQAPIIRAYHDYQSIISPSATCQQNSCTETLEGLSWQEVPNTVPSSPRRPSDQDRSVVEKPLSAFVEVNGVSRSGNTIVYDMVDKFSAYSRRETNCSTNQFRVIRWGHFESQTRVNYSVLLNDNWESATSSESQALMNFVCQL